MKEWPKCEICGENATYRITDMEEQVGLGIPYELAPHGHPIIFVLII